MGIFSGLRARLAALSATPEVEAATLADIETVRRAVRAEAARLGRRQTPLGHDADGALRRGPAPPRPLPDHRPPRRRGRTPECRAGLLRQPQVRPGRNGRSGSSRSPQPMIALYRLCSSGLKISAVRWRTGAACAEVGEAGTGLGAQRGEIPAASAGMTEKCEHALMPTSAYGAGSNTIWNSIRPSSAIESTRKPTGASIS